MKITLDITLLVNVGIAFVAALVVCFAATPIVDKFAFSIGAVDDPNRDGRRMHTVPKSRIGGLAIFLGFVVSVVLFAELNRQVQSILIGLVIIVITGAIDDIIDLKWWIKGIAQIGAASIAVFWGGVVVERVSNPLALFIQNAQFIELGILAVPCTIIWILAVTNSVNFIDGLDGLAVGVSGISGATMVVTALIVSDGNSALIMAALCGACIGFMPFNLNPSKLFMGDSGALTLGYVLATMSVLGVFKFYAVVSFVVPFLILALPIFDETFAVFRRLAKGMKPWDGDRGHLHHRLIDMGLTQKQAVAVCYWASAVLGLLAVVMTTDGGVKAFLLALVLLIAAVVAVKVFKKPRNDRNAADASKPDLPGESDEPQR
ncbi:MAG: undecaprenyl/decaprenyl-phosphate alpha-N-acetylglucosaminyl 1-phosphate transferase [Oscillospiraceae bacterium]|jgi:UDP-GlcNAc:undecaprenyl-phosphate GlcNAc-1-phosphate transferase|nr:undecaprenyl/decaprenyl-phosphate alpha-N-acetylglucosaminyl 1-phosphate transferase [Oscillospiraceae bacterium]